MVSFVFSVAELNLLRFEEFLIIDSEFYESRLLDVLGLDFRKSIILKVMILIYLSLRTQVEILLTTLKNNKEMRKQHLHKY